METKNSNISQNSMSHYKFILAPPYLKSRHSDVNSPQGTHRGHKVLSVWAHDLTYDLTMPNHGLI